MSPLAVVVALLVCVALGYAMVKGFSSPPQASSLHASANFKRGDFLDAPLPREITVKTEVTVNVNPPQAEQNEAAANDARTGAQAEPQVDGGEPEKVARPDLPDPETVADPIEKEQLVGEHLDLPFAKISNYRYIFPDVEDGENIPDQIPESIKKLDGRKVAIRGFMLPVTQKNGVVTEFLLLKDQSMCCYGTMPQMNEWVHVIMTPGQSAPMVWDIPITVFGKFEVGEVFENGVLMTIYRLRFEKLVKPELAK